MIDAKLTQKYSNDVQPLASPEISDQKDWKNVSDLQNK
jgi:hypothetical protein